MLMLILEGVFVEEECYMINGVLMLVLCFLCGIMMLCGEISWVDVNFGVDEICE